MNEIVEYWDRKPCEAWHGTAEVGSIEWSQQISVRRYFVQPHIIEFADFGRWKGKKVLEIGCGIGTDTLQFLRSGASVDAIDASQKSVDLTVERCSGKAEDYFSAQVGNAEEWLPECQYDLIYSFGVLHHTPHPEKVLQLASKRLAPNGELRIMLYAKWSIKKLLRIQPEAQAGCPLVRWYSKREARRLLESCGFRVVSIEKTHIFPWRIPDYVQHKYVRAFPWNAIPPRLFRWLETKLGHHLLIVAVKA